MNKLLVAVVATTLGAASAAALADDGNFFVNGDLGQSHYRIASSYTVAPSIFDGGYRYSADKQDVAGALRFGYRWHSLVDYGVEAGYVDLGQAETKFNGPYTNLKTDQKTRGWLVGGNLKYNIAEKWYVSARGGWFRSRNEVDARGVFFVQPLAGDQPNFRSHSSNTGTGEYLGLGAGYNILPNLSVGLSYDNYHARLNRSSESDSGLNIALYSVSAEYRF